MENIKACRFCKSENLATYLDLGFSPPSDKFVSEEQLNHTETHYPLKVVLCKSCGLNQLSYTVDPKILYQEDYPYESSMTKTGVDHYHALAETVANRFSLTNKDLVIDVGSNVGILLEGFKKRGVRVLGVDPAKNIAQVAIKRGIPTIADFFTPKVTKSIKKKHGLAKVILGTNVFAHIYNHHEFMEALNILLANDGVFIFESPHVMHLVKNLEYDTVYHEHLLYLSLKPVIQLAKNYGMEIFDVEEFPIHGGSFRVFIGRSNFYPVSQHVAEMLRAEEQIGVHSEQKLRKFAQAVAAHRIEFVTLLKNLKQKGKTIAVVSTPAKGMTLLNYCRIGPELIDFATEKSTLKIGKFTPGTHIPIYPDSELLKRKPDYVLLLAWNFSKEIMKGLAEYKKAGGRFIIPIPKPKIV